MDHLRSFMLLLALLLLGGGALVVWALHPGGYPDVAYYQREQLTMTEVGELPVELDEWIDPRRGIVRGEVRIGPQGAQLYIRDGIEYFFSSAGALGRGEPLAPQQARYYAWLFGTLARGGYRGVGEALLAQRSGPVAYLRFDGRAAIRFASAAPSLLGGYSAVWLDASSLDPLQVGSSGSAGSPSSERFLRTARLPPGSLPAGYLDLPRADRSAWDRALDWLRLRLDGRR